MTEVTELKWGDYAIATADIPPANLSVLAQYGFSHFMGNQQASKIASWKKTEEGEAASDDEAEAKAKEFRDAAFARITEGELGVRVSTGTGASARNPFEALCKRIAVERLTAKLKKLGHKLPTGDKVLSIGGKDMTRDDLVAAEMRHGQAAIEAEAKRRQAETAEAEGDLEELFA